MNAQPITRPKLIAVPSGSPSPSRFGRTSIERRLEERQNDEQQERDDRRDAEDRRERRAEADAEPARHEHHDQHDERDHEDVDRDLDAELLVDRPERAAEVDVRGAPSDRSAARKALIGATVNQPSQ